MVFQWSQVFCKEEFILKVDVYEGGEELSWKHANYIVYYLWATKLESYFAGLQSDMCCDRGTEPTLTYLEIYERVSQCWLRAHGAITFIGKCPPTIIRISFDLVETWPGTYSWWLIRGEKTESEVRLRKTKTKTKKKTVDIFNEWNAILCLPWKRNKRKS